MGTDGPEVGPRPGATLVVGVGNPLRGDDGVGVQVVRRLLEQGLPDGWLAEELAGGWLRLLDLLPLAARLVVVDAVDIGLAPGSVVEIAMPRQAAPAPCSPVTGHDVGLTEVLALAADLGLALPAEVRLVGIQTANASAYSQELSAAVEGSVAEACAAVRRLAAR